MGYIGLGAPDAEDLNKLVRKINEHTALLKDIQRRLDALEKKEEK